MYIERKKFDIYHPCIPNQFEINLNTVENNERYNDPIKIKEFPSQFCLDRVESVYRIIGSYNRQKCFELIDNASNIFYTKKGQIEHNIFNLTEDVLQSIQEVAKVSLSYYSYR